MDIFYNRFKILLSQNPNITQKDIADRTGIDKTCIHKYVKGKAIPKSTNLFKIAEMFNVSAVWLSGEDVPMNNSSDTKYPHPIATPNYTTFPVVGEIAAGYNTPPLEDWEGEKIDVPTSYLNGRDASEYFVLEVKGNSMYPHYQEGDKVLILRQNTPDYSGQVAAVIYDNEFATLKKIEYPPNKEWVKLVPVNPNFEEQKIEKNDLENFIIMGVPKLLIRDIDKV